MSTQHTHGPWELRHAADNSGDIGIVGDGGCLAECFPAIRSANEGAHAECGANAKLIAAAPDLLAALIAACAQLADVELMLPSDAGDFMTPVLENAHAAIAKATGAPAPDVRYCRAKEAQS